MRTNHYLSKLHLGDLISCFVCEQNSFVWQFKCRHFFSRVLHAWITGIRPGRLDASIVGDDWGEFEMIKIILYKLLQSYQLSGSPRFACHKRCLYMIILIALNDNDDDHHHHLCCLLRFSRLGIQSVRMCKEHAEPFSPPTQWRKRMLCVHVLVSWSKVDSSESAI